MITSIGTKMKYGMGALATTLLMSLAACNVPKDEKPVQNEEFKPKTELKIAQEQLEAAQKQYEKDSLDFMEADSVSAKIRLQRLQQLRKEYHQVSPEDTIGVGALFYDYYNAIAEATEKKVPVDSNAVKIDNAVNEAQKEYDKATGKIAQKSKLIRDNAQKEVEAAKQREIERKIEEARQDSINKANAKKIEEEHKVREAEYIETINTIKKAQENIKKQEKEELELAKKIKKELDLKTKAHKDSVMKEFEKIEKK